MGKRLEQFITNVDNSIDSRLPQTPEAIARRRKALLVIGGVATTAGLLFGGKAIVESVQAPDFSTTTVEHMATENDTLWGIAGEVDGADQVDRRDIIDYIQDLDANKKALEDGLDQGDVIERPTSVSK